MPSIRSIHGTVFAVCSLCVLTAALASCDDASPADKSRGGPFSSGSGDAGAADRPGDAASDSGADTKLDGVIGNGGAAGKDAAAVDGKDAAMASGGATGSSGGSVGGTGNVTGSGGAPVQSCADCEAKNCTGLGVPRPYLTECHDPKDASGMPAKAMVGPATGRLKKDLCEAVLKCVRENPDKCLTWALATTGADDVAPCYCGKGVSDDDCQANKASGPCKTEVENAAEIGSQGSAGADVAQNFVNPMYAVGAAVDLIQECDEAYCRASCLGLSGGDVIRGATGGATGSGTGGRGTGSGGAIGSGGSGTLASGGATAGATGGSAGAAGGTPTITYNKCRTCEQMQCPDFVTSCEQAAGNAVAGPKTGTPRKDLCLAVVACVRAKKCSVDGDVAFCYCGTADLNGTCMGGGGNGPCKAEIEAAAESTDPPVVTGERFTNPDPLMKMPYAIGFATDLLGCDGFSCADASCMTGDPAVAGSGGAVGGGGNGGSPGTAGRIGAGGATGSGGIVGTGGARTGGTVGTGGVGTGGVGTGGVGTGGTGTGGASGAGVVALANPDFATSGDAWTAEYSMLAVWTGTKDAAGSASSGALGVSNTVVADIDGNTMGGARQCVSVVAARAYAAATQAFIPSGQAGGGSAALDLAFYPSSNCTGAVDGEYTSGLVATANAWTPIQGTTTAPSSARSAAVRLVVVKAFRAPAFQVIFDNASLRLQ
jgi:hypothetical protein